MVEAEFSQNPNSYAKEKENHTRPVFQLFATILAISLHREKCDSQKKRRSPLRGFSTEIFC